VQNAAQLLFLRCLFREVSLVTMSHPSPRTVAPPHCLSLYIKDLLKEDEGSIGGWIDWLAACKRRKLLLRLAACEAAAGCCVSASLRTKTLRENMGSASLRAKTLREIKENMGVRV
jgi:hypothetical protein